MLRHARFIDLLSSTARFRHDCRGNISVLFSIMAIPALALVGASIDYTRSTGMYAQAQAAADAAVLAAGAQAGATQAARQTIASALERVALRNASQWVPGSRQRKLSVAVLPRRLSSERLAFPAYVLAYRYRGKLYRAVVNGQDAGIVTGKAPYSIARIALAILGGIAAIALVFVILSVAR